MTETITESFCERCGTRYEFEAPRLTTMRKTRGLIGGLRNYLTSQDALSDAMNDAMRTEEESLAAVQLDAFHSSFSFCIDCRQYTCTNCWNNTAGRCRSCVPIPGTDDLSERLAAPVRADADETFVGAAALSAEPVEAWPTSDLPTEVEGWPGADAFPAEPREPLVAETPAWVSDDVVAEPGTELAALDDNGWIVGEAPPEPEHWPDSPGAEPEPVPVIAEDEPEPTRPPLRVVAWDEDGTFETVEPEPEPVVAEVEPEPEPEPVVADARWDSSCPVAVCTACTPSRAPKRPSSSVNLAAATSSSFGAALERPGASTPDDPQAPRGASRVAASRVRLRTTGPYLSPSGTNGRHGGTGSRRACW